MQESYTLKIKIKEKVFFSTQHKYDLITATLVAEVIKYWPGQTFGVINKSYDNIFK